MQKIIKTLNRLQYKIILNLLIKIIQQIKHLPLQIKLFYNLVKQNLHKLPAKLRYPKIQQHYSAPWYVVVGAAQSGKKSTISNLGLYYAEPRQFGEQAITLIQQFPNYNWWFSKEAFFVNPMSSKVTHSPDSWQHFLKMMSKRRKSKLPRGIIFTYSLTDTVHSNAQQTQEFFNELAYYLNQLNNDMKTTIPVYLIFTKTDQVCGFNEFFHNIKNEELDDVWGICIPSNCLMSAEIIEYFNHAFFELLTRLRQHIVSTLNVTPDLESREIIYSFPQQMQMLKIPIENFIKELLDFMSFNKALHLRGLYFVSNHQDGVTNNILLYMMSQKFELETTTLVKSPHTQKCHFVRRLFHKVLQSDAFHQQRLFPSEVQRKLIIMGVYIFLPVLFLLLCLIQHSVYNEDVRKITKLELPSSDLPIIPLLDKLYRADQFYQQQNNFFGQLLFVNHSLKHALDEAFANTLTNRFMPMIAAEIETTLHRNNYDENLLYDLLKAYLAFRSPTSKDDIKEPITYIWASQAKQNQQRLSQYLNIALKHSVPMLPLNEALINHIKVKLQLINPAQRAFGLLTLDAMSSDIPPLKLIDEKDDHFSELFISQPATIAIPNLYTQKGYTHLFLKKYSYFAEEVVDDNRRVGLFSVNDPTYDVTHITTDMLKMYRQQRHREWQTALDNINIKKFDTLDDIIKQISLMTETNADFTYLLNVIHVNTNDIAEFKNLNHFITAKDAVSWNSATIMLQQLHDYLMQLKHSADLKQSCYNAIVLDIKSNRSPIQTLTNFANQSPAPFNRWFMSIANNSWNIVLQNTQQYLNQLWRNQILSIYDLELSGRYPLNTSVNSQINIITFNQFFGAGGTIDQYYDNYLKPFINMNTEPWSIYAINGRSLKIPTTTIDFYKQFKAIQAVYFPNNSHDAKLTLSIKPQLLAKDASRSSLILGKQVINYSHGPQEITLIHWPLTEDNNQVGLIISGFAGEQYTQFFPGAWSILQLFEAGSVKKINDQDFIFNITLHGYTAAYLISSSNNNPDFLMALRKFKLPLVVAGGTLK